MTTFGTTEKCTKGSNKFLCEKCDYASSRLSQYNRHLTTSKHMNHDELSENNAPKCSTKLYTCICSKIYNDRAGLWRHKKKCTGEKEKDQGIKLSITETDNSSSSSNNLIIEVLKQNQEFKELLLEQCKQPFSSSSQTPETNAALIMELLKQNNEFKELLIEQNKTILDLASKAGNTTNNNNNTTNNNNFNLHIFLNEKCKNAMNITDFVDTIKVQLTDLEAFGTHGYCEGITRVFMRYLNELDICKRPIHCSDLKREIMYVKDKDAWEKDDDRKLIKKAIDKIERKNHLTIPAWQVANPEFNQYDSKVNDVYNKMLIEAMGGETKEENDKNYSKITRSIAKGTIITKNPL